MCALSQKTVVLVTHQVEFLSEVDHILVIRITFDGFIYSCAAKCFPLLS